jgi:hypothetical protein
MDNKANNRWRGRRAGRGEEDGGSEELTVRPP